MSITEACGYHVAFARGYLMFAYRDNFGEGEGR